MRGICIPTTEYAVFPTPGQGYLNPGLCNEEHGRKRRLFITLIKCYHSMGHAFQFWIHIYNMYASNEGTKLSKTE